MSLNFPQAEAAVGDAIAEVAKANAAAAQKNKRQTLIVCAVAVAVISDRGNVAQLNAKVFSREVVQVVVAAVKSVDRL